MVYFMIMMHSNKRGGTHCMVGNFGQGGNTWRKII